MQTVLIVDGDLVVYRNAAAIEKRTILVTHKPSNKTKQFDTRTEFKEFLNQKNYPYVPEEYLIEDQQSAENPIVAFRLIRKLLQELADFCFADRVEVYLSPKNSNATFRHSLPLPKPYKGNRGSLKPVHLAACKKFLFKNFDTTFSPEYLETDDLITIRAYEELALGNRPILATIDKDAYQSQGIELLNWNREPWEIRRIDSLGHLKEGNHKTIQGEGLMFLAYQTLAGDTTDTYKPYELAKIRYGSISAYNALKDAKDEKEVLSIVLSEYKRMYPSAITYNACDGSVQTKDWEGMLDLYWNCAYMKRSHYDYSNFWEYAKQYGVTKE